MFPDGPYIEWAGGLILLFVVGAANGRRWGAATAVLGGIAAIGLALIVPVGTASLFYALVAVVGAPGAATFILAGALLARIFGRGQVEVASLAIVLVGLGLLLLPAAMGLGPVDPYRFGFSGMALPLLCAGILAVSFVTRSTMVAAWMVAACALNLSGLHPSLNFWDHLIDVPGLLIALALLIGDALAARRSGRLSPARAADAG